MVSRLVPLVDKATSLLVAAHDVLAGRVLDVQGRGGLNDAHAVFDYHFDEAGTQGGRNARIATPLEVRVALVALAFGGRFLLKGLRELPGGVDEPAGCVRI